MDITLAIKHIYPKLNSREDFEVFDLGEGIFVEWKSEKPQPTEEELQTAWNDYLANLPAPPKTDIQILGEQLVAKDFEIMELRQLNDSLGTQVVDHDIRLMMGGL
jgi:hypothetical protein